MSLLEKGLDFCPSSNDINKEELLDVNFSYCRTICLKHHFDTSNQNNNSTDSSSVKEIRSTEFDERCKMKSIFLSSVEIYTTESRKVSRSYQNGHHEIGRKTITNCIKPNIFRKRNFKLTEKKEPIS